MMSPKEATDSVIDDRADANSISDDTRPFTANLYGTLPSRWAYDRYEILMDLGKGGVGMVFLARQIFSQIEHPHRFRLVAFKVLRDDKLTAALKELLLEQAMTLAELNNDNVVRVIDFGQFNPNEEDGFPRHAPYLAMEYVAGITLKELISQLRKLEYNCPPVVAAALIARVCKGLDAIHNLRDRENRLRRAIHRDVKPSNIMLTDKGGIKILDVGTTARTASETGSRADFTIAYAAPEVFKQECESTRQSDLFSLGIILHELVSETPLFNSDDTISHIGELETFEYSAPNNIPRWLQKRLTQMLARNPDHRPITAAALAEQLFDDVQREDPSMLREDKCRQTLIDIGIIIDKPVPKNPSTCFPYRSPRIRKVDHTKLDVIELEHGKTPKKTLIKSQDIEIVYLARRSDDHDGCIISICDSAKPDKSIAGLDLNLYMPRQCVEFKPNPKGRIRKLLANERSVTNFQSPINSKGEVGIRFESSEGPSVSSTIPLTFQYQMLGADRRMEISELELALHLNDAHISRVLVLRQRIHRTFSKVWCIGVWDDA